MHFTCDLIVTVAYERHFDEWVLYICADSFSDAANFAERHIKKLDITAAIDEMSLQAMPPAADAKEALRSRDQPGVYHEFGPRELGTYVHPLRRLMSWIKGE